MKRIIFFAIILFTPFSPGLAQMPNHALDENIQQEQEIRTVVAQFAEAFAKADTAVLKSLLADDYVHSNANGGVLDKTRWLAFAKTRHEDLKSGKVRGDTLKHPLRIFL